MGDTGPNRPMPRLRRCRMQSVLSGTMANSRGAVAPALSSARPQQ